MATSLTSGECRSSGEALDLFSKRKGLLVLRQVPQYCIMMGFTVPSGCYALVTSHRADLDYMDEDEGTQAVWPAGLHFPYLPWVGVSYFVTKLRTIFRVTFKDCRTKDDYDVNIDVVLTFRIRGDPDLGEDSNLVRKFVHELTPSGLERQLRDAVGGVVRSLVRSIDHTDVYGMRSDTNETLDSVIDVNEIVPTSTSSSSSNEEMISSLYSISPKLTSYRANDNNKGKRVEVPINTLNERFYAQGVEITSAIIENVLRPKEIQSQMEDQSLSISAKVEGLMRRENLAQSSSMEDEIQTKLQKSSNVLLQEEQVAHFRTNLQKLQLNEEMVQAEKSAAEVREDSKIRIKKFVVSNEYAIQSVKDKTATDAAKINLKTELLNTEQIADTKRIGQSCLADASLFSIKQKVEREKVLADAEKKTASWERTRRKFAVGLKTIEVYNKLASNKDLTLDGSSDETMSLLSVADSILDPNTRESNDNLSPTSVAAEISILKQKLNASEKKTRGFEKIEKKKKGNAIVSFDDQR